MQITEDMAAEAPGRARKALSNRSKILCEEIVSDDVFIIISDRFNGILSMMGGIEDDAVSMVSLASRSTIDCESSS